MLVFCHEIRPVNPKILNAIGLDFLGYILRVSLQCGGPMKSIKLVLEVVDNRTIAE